MTSNDGFHLTIRAAIAQELITGGNTMKLRKL